MKESPLSRSDASKALQIATDDSGAAVTFDRNGNAGPTIWYDGRVVGGWASGRTSGIAVRLLEDVGAEAAAAIETEAERLGRWLGPTRITPRFRTPLEQELSG